MICTICKNGSISPGFTTLTFEKEKTTIVIKKVPADICDNCGEAYVSDEIARKIFHLVETEAKKGIEIEVLNFAA